MGKVALNPAVTRIRPPGESRLPVWLKKNLREGHVSTETDSVLKDLGLHTICESGRCPNRNECYSHRTATFMIMGDKCTRRCGYCSVNTAKPDPLDREEPARISQAVGALGLKHVVITTVTRDDLPDEGVGHFGEVVGRLRRDHKDLVIEILSQDFKRNPEAAVERLKEFPMDIYSHNLETVRRIHRSVRPGGGYDLSLGLLGRMARSAPGMLIKSGAMLGMGEEREEVISLMDDLVQAGCQILTLGQYLAPTAQHHPVTRFVRPDEFEEYRSIGYNKGFLVVESGPFVRSSYHAKDSFEKLMELLRKRS